MEQTQTIPTTERMLDVISSTPGNDAIADFLIDAGVC